MSFEPYKGIFNEGEKGKKVKIEEIYGGKEIKWRLILKWKEGVKWGF